MFRQNLIKVPLPDSDTDAIQAINRTREWRGCGIEPHSLCLYIYIVHTSTYAIKGIVLSYLTVRLKLYMPLRGHLKWMEPLAYTHTYHTYIYAIKGTYLNIYNKRNRTFVPDRETEAIHVTNRALKMNGTLSLHSYISQYIL